MNVLQLWDATALLRETRIVRQGREDICLSQGQQNLGVLFRIDHDQILNLIAPEQGISLLALGLVPYLEQLLDAPGTDKMGLLLGLWPIESRPLGSLKVISVSRSTHDSADQGEGVGEIRTRDP